MSKNERIIAALSPLSYMLAGYVFVPLMILIPLGIYIYSKRKGLEFSRLHSLRLIDFLVSTIIYTLVFGAIYVAIELVERDAGKPDSAFILGNEIALLIFGVFMFLYLFIPTVIAIYKAFLGNEYKYPLSLKPFETLGGKSGSNNGN